MSSLDEAIKLREKYTHFRILVIGRANAGKTTLLQRVCNTTEEPSIYDANNNHLLVPKSERGIHDVHRPFTFKSNPKFIFHDSPGFEAGGEDELKKVLSFIEEKAKSTDVGEQIHAIWFCVTPDVSRPLLPLEEKFFNERRAGNVPVVAIFTKFDDLVTQVLDRDKDYEENKKVAEVTLKKKFQEPLENYKFGPRAYVRFESLDDDEGNHQEQVKGLIEETASSIDDLALKMLFVTVQQNNLEVCIKYAINPDLIRYTSDTQNLIRKIASWFPHCYSEGHDYGKTQRGGGGGRGIRDVFAFAAPFAAGRFASKVKDLVMAQYKAPSLCALAAIIICVENSFWLAKKGAVGFQTAWAIYLDSHQVHVHLALDSYLQPKGTADWFGIYHQPSKEECREIVDLVLKNLLPPSDHST